jgi:YcxB-like protein
MQFPVSYQKNQTLQALRFHFISKKEIKLVLILVNVFAITAAVLFYMKKIRPEPFLLGTCIWLLLMIAVWYILPFSVYKKTALFKQNFLANLSNDGLQFETENGYTNWAWTEFNTYTESPNFFFLYFNERSFLLLPSENLTADIRHDIRGILRTQIAKNKMIS